MATMAAGQRGRRLAFAPLRVLAATARDSTFVIAGIPVHLIALGVLLAPCAVLFLVRRHPEAWFAIGVVSVALVLAARAPLTAIQRHRCWSLLGVDIPRQPRRPAARPLLARTVASLRAESTWRQLALSPGWPARCWRSAACSRWPPGRPAPGWRRPSPLASDRRSGQHQFQSPKPLIALTVAGGLVAADRAVRCAGP